MARPISKVTTLTKEEFEELVKSCTCISSVVEALGYSKASGSVGNKVRDRIKSDNIDTSHFIYNRAKFKDTSKLRIHQLEDILVENSTYANIARLKIRLVSEKVFEYICTECGNKGEWNGKPISLQLDHINGKHNDHRIENLRFLCPNCHSQTDTYGGRNSGEYL